jgi:hypothetical protein
MARSVQGATRGLPPTEDRQPPRRFRLAAGRRCKIRHAAVDALAREFGLEAPLRIRRARLWTCSGIARTSIWPWAAVHEHLLSIDNALVEPLALAHSIGHELCHALDAERVLRAEREAAKAEDRKPDANVWADYCDRNADATRAVGGHYEDQRHEQAADLMGALLSYRILRDCLVVA